MREPSSPVTQLCYLVVVDSFLRQFQGAEREQANKRGARAERNSSLKSWPTSPTRTTRRFHIKSRLSFVVVVIVVVVVVIEHFTYPHIFTITVPKVPTLRSFFS